MSLVSLMSQEVVTRLKLPMIQGQGTTPAQVTTLELEMMEEEATT